MSAASATDSEPGQEPAAESPASAPPSARHPLTLPHFRNLWLGSQISVFGDQFYIVALPWLVLQLTGSSVTLGAILTTAAIPRVVLMLVGGAVTDRVSPRRVLVLTTLVRMTLVGTMAALVWFKAVQLWHIYALTLAFGVANGFSFPAVGALIPSMVLPQQLQRANSLLQSSTVTTQMLGATPAGLAVKYWGVATALLLDALSFLAVLFSLIKIPDVKSPSPPPGAPPRPNMLRSIGDGLRAVRNDRPLLSLMVIFATINLCMAGPIGVGLASMARFHFGSVAALGTLLSCMTGGTLAGTILGGVVKKPRRRGLQLILMGTLTGFALIAIGLVLELVTTRAAIGTIGALLAVIGMGTGYTNVQFGTWVQLRVERAVLGRVLSVLSVFSVGLVPLSFAFAGLAAEWNLPGLYLGTGALLAVISLSMALANKAARDIE